MTARSLSGKELAARLRARSSRALAECAAAGIAVRLAVVLATRDESAAWYVRSLRNAAGRLGIGCDVSELPADARAADITAVLAALSSDASVHGILAQTPLPAGLALAELGAAIDPAKDVDGASPVSRRPGLITAGHVRPGAVVIEVGTSTAADGSLVGDVDAPSVSAVAGAPSPVPGGVGAVTTVQLLLNTVLAAACGQPGFGVG